MSTQHIENGPPAHHADAPLPGDQKALVRAQPNGVAAQGFNGQPNIIHEHETASTAAAIQAKTQVEARYVMALRNPRSLMQFRAKLLDACKRPKFAESARYAKPIGHEKVRGWSIRFAEEAARSLGNLLVESAVLYDGPSLRVVRVMVTDLETNLTYPTDVSIEKTVERKNAKGRTIVSSRTNSNGEITHVVVATDDEVFNKQNSLVSKAMRNAILRVVPGDILEEALEQVQDTMQKEDAVDPAAKAKKIADAFYAEGVMPDRLEKVLGHPIAQCTPAEVSMMRTWITALKEGEATWKDIEEGFGAKAAAEDGAAPAASPTSSNLRDRLKKQTTNGTAAPAAEAQPASEEAKEGNLL